MPEKMYEICEPDEKAVLEKIEVIFDVLEGEGRIELKGGTFVVNDKEFVFKNSMLSKEGEGQYRLTVTDIDVEHFKKKNGEFLPIVAAPDVYDGEWQQFMLYANEGTDVTGIESIKMYCSDGSWLDADSDFIEEIGEKLLLVYR